MLSRELSKQRTGTKTIRTERLVLRKMMPHDYFSVIKWFTDPEIARFSMNRKPLTKWQVFRFLLGRIKQYRKKSFYSWAIVYDRRMQGFVELLPLKNNDNAFSLSYKLNMKLNNKGIMTEAVKGVIEYSKTQGFVGLLGVCDIDNIGSKRVLEKSGMIQFGNPDTDEPLHYTDATTGKKLRFKIKFN